MEEQCLVICGDWVCGHGSRWEFVVDKQQMGRLVPVSDGITVKELGGSVLREFGKDETCWVAILSYWPPSSMELATGIRTPPVQLTSDGAIKYFVQHLRVKGCMNLFVRFEQKISAVDSSPNVDDTGMGFVTPVSLAPKRSATSVSGVLNGVNVSTGASKAKGVNFIDLEFINEVERVESELNSVGKSGGPEVRIGSRGGEGSNNVDRVVEG